MRGLLCDVSIGAHILTLAAHDNKRIEAHCALSLAIAVSGLGSDAISEGAAGSRVRGGRKEHKERRIPAVYTYSHQGAAAQAGCAVRARAMLAGMSFTQNST